ncbi:ribosome silencing factor [bacterium]|nr:ribosome silencing factor [bacterium]
METPYLLSKITQSALDLKAINLFQFDMEGKSSLTDYMVVCHGTSTAHVQGIADRIAFDLKKDGLLPLGIEGYNEGTWILLDFNAVIVHIFLEETRKLYNFEELFQDYPSKSFE